MEEEDIAGALYRARMARILGVGGVREAHIPGWGHSLYWSSDDPVRNLAH
jgi:hypothetical protein